MSARLECGCPTDVVQINKHSGRIELELTRDSAQRVCSSHKLRELESTVNGGADALPAVADFLMRQVHE